MFAIGTEWHRDSLRQGINKGNPGLLLEGNFQTTVDGLGVQQEAATLSQVDKSDIEEVGEGRERAPESLQGCLDKAAQR